ncbi:NADP oxidoreductase [Demequina sp. TTPB684]|uniref:NADPH-dependent F420 reductase n=1 Tax=unclassified Demequina TaxID=2620311 RepID=UPI001CF38883|nr:MULTISPECIES: NADP oxidoreductase [unclassified Demequina]MCB2413269.1 NADP oxidoreductase [Demequina sp. TTPB684]UPU88729.1 NADP oxidoreductase [Demequina sp. TMPB413]
MADPPAIRSVGILGAGRVGRALAQLARDAGLGVTVAGSQDQAGIADAVRADAVILAIPLGKYRTLPANALSVALVIDAMNYWWELDGRLPEFEDATTSSSEIVASFLSGARVVKAFNHASVWELENLAAPAGDPQRRALAVAGDDAEAVAAVASLVDAMGFDPVAAGPLKEGVRFEPTTEAFGADATKAELQEMLESFWDSQRGRVVARARNRQG